MAIRALSPRPRITEGSLGDRVLEKLVEDVRCLLPFEARAFDAETGEVEPAEVPQRATGGLDQLEAKSHAEDLVDAGESLELYAASSDPAAAMSFSARPFSERR